MNKYVVIIIVLVVLIGGGVVYKNFIASDQSQPQTSGVVKQFTLTAKKDVWKWDPEIIEVDQGDKVVLTIVNEDTYDHGIAIDAFGVSQRVPAKQSITLDFVVTQPGEFPFYCSVPCGSGEVDGVVRGHLDQAGKLKVRAVIKELPVTPPAN